MKKEFSKILVIVLIMIAIDGYTQSTNYVEGPHGTIDMKVEYSSDGNISPVEISEMIFEFKITNLTDTRRIVLIAGNSFGDDSGLNAVLSLVFDQDKETYNLFYNGQPFGMYEGNYFRITVPFRLSTYANWRFCEISTVNQSNESSNPIQFNL